VITLKIFIKVFKVFFLVRKIHKMKDIEKDFN